MSYVKFVQTSVRSVVVDQGRLDDRRKSKKIKWGGWTV